MKSIASLILVLFFASSGVAKDTENAEYWNKLGLSYKEQVEYKEAEDAFKKAIQINPEDAEAYNNLGRLYFKSGRYEEAIDYFEQALSRQPHGTGIYRNLGAANAQLGRYSEAVDVLQKAVRIDPADADAHLDLGKVYLMMEDRDSALKQYNILKELNPDQAAYLLNLIHK
jgi:tetratricopeptide (TPR) repeat protein